MIKDDEIIEPIRRYREAHAASSDYDLERIVQDLQREEAESGVKTVTRAPRKPSAVPKQSSG
jgi:hypothetical protein